MFLEREKERERERERAIPLEVNITWTIGNGLEVEAAAEICLSAGWQASNPNNRRYIATLTGPGHDILDALIYIHSVADKPWFLDFMLLTPVAARRRDAI